LAILVFEPIDREKMLNFDPKTLESQCNYYIGTRFGVIEGYSDPILLEYYIEDLRLAIIPAATSDNKECLDMIKVYCATENIAFVDLAKCENMNDVLEKIQDQRRKIHLASGWQEKFNIEGHVPPPGSGVILRNGEYLIKTKATEAPLLSFTVPATRGEKFSLEADVKVISGTFRFSLMSGGQVMTEKSWGSIFHGLFWINYEHLRSAGDLEIRVSMDPASDGTLIVSGLRLNSHEGSVGEGLLAALVADLPEFSESLSTASPTPAPPSQPDLLSLSLPLESSPKKYYTFENDPICQKMNEIKQLSLSFSELQVQSVNVLNPLEAHIGKLLAIRSSMLESFRNTLEIDLNEVIRTKVEKFISEVLQHQGPRVGVTFSPDGKATLKLENLCISEAAMRGLRDYLSEM
jgi:hypothetical protein